MGILKLQDWLLKHKYHRLSQSTESSDCQCQGGTYTILLKLLRSLLCMENAVSLTKGLTTFCQA